MAEPLVHRGQGVLDRARGFQPLGLQLGPGKLQRLGEELETPHVEEELLESPLEGAVILLTRGQPRSFREARQGRCLAPGHADDCVHQHRDEPELGEDLVVLRGEEGLLGEVGGRERAAGVLVLLVKASRGSPGHSCEGVLSVQLTALGRARVVEHHSVAGGGGRGHDLELGGAGPPHVARARVVVVPGRHVVHHLVTQRPGGGAEDGGQ